ncbi:hypothetical protein MHYP_G00246760 [Metynnis hypsauchen]
MDEVTKRFVSVFGFSENAGQNQRNISSERVDTRTSTSRGRVIERRGSQGVEMAKKRANKRIKALETAEEASKFNVPGEKERHEVLDHIKDKGSSPGSSRSVTSDLSPSSMSKCELLEEKLRWLEQKIKDLEDERDFLRDQLRNKGMLPEVMSEDTKANLGQADSLSESSDSTGISDSSESDQPLRKAKKKKKHMDIKVAKPAHARAQGPEQVIKRYRKVLKTFSKVRTMTEAFSRK